MYAIRQTDDAFLQDAPPVLAHIEQLLSHRDPPGTTWQFVVFVPLASSPAGQENFMSPKSRAICPNQLLAALPMKERDSFIADCTLEKLAFGTVLYEQGDRMRFVYFPTEGFISMLTTVDRRSTLEVGMIGSEGMCGYALNLGGNVSSLRALVQGTGEAWRMKTVMFLRHLEHMPALRQVLGRYIHVILGQLSQAAACLRFHVVEKRLARWLLMTQDRAHTDSFDVTQEFLAYMLGVRRSGVSIAASILQSRKLIRYTRGTMVILNRERLEAVACACYRSDLNTYKHGMAAGTKR